MRSCRIKASSKPRDKLREHAQSRTGDSRFDDDLGYRLTVTARTPSLVTDSEDVCVIPRLRASKALAAGFRKFAPQALGRADI